MWGKPVEVRKHDRSTTWYQAVLIDCKNSDQARVRFPRDETIYNPDFCSFGENANAGSNNDIWTDKAINMKGCVRERVRPGSTLDSWDPKTGDNVEISFEANDHFPGGWALGKVVDKKGNFYFVNFVPDQ